MLTLCHPTICCYIFYHQKIEKDFKPFTVPVFLTSGWYDAFLSNTLHIYFQLPQSTPRCLIVSHHAHVLSFAYPGGIRGGCGELTVSRNAATTFKLLEKQVAFVRRFMGVQGAATSNDNSNEKSNALLFMIGRDEWLSFQQFPPPSADVSKRQFYLGSQGDARSIRGNGRLFEENMIGENEDTPEGDEVLFDYGKPIPTKGKCCISP